MVSRRASHGDDCVSFEDIDVEFIESSCRNSNGYRVGGDNESDVGVWGWWGYEGLWGRTPDQLPEAALACIQGWVALGVFAHNLARGLLPSRITPRITYSM